RLGLDHGLDPATSLFVVLRTLLLFHRDLPLEVRPTEKRPAILSNAKQCALPTERQRAMPMDRPQSLSRTGSMRCWPICRTSNGLVTETVMHAQSLPRVRCMTNCR